MSTRCVSAGNVASGSRKTGSGQQMCGGDMTQRKRFSTILAVAAVFCLFAAIPAAAQSGSSSNTQKLQLPESGATIAIPAGWSHHQYANVHELLNLPAEKLTTMQPTDRDEAARIGFTVFHLKNHDEALTRLKQIEAEYAAAATYLTVAGWPALQRQNLVPKPVRADEESGEAVKKMLVMVTTAVAVDDEVFRMDGFVAADSPLATSIAGQMLTMGRGVTFKKPGSAAKAEQEVQTLKGSQVPRTVAPQAAPVSALQEQVASASSGFSINVIGLNVSSEPEIAVSTDGKNVVIAQQRGFVSSQNGGLSFSGRTGFPQSTGGDSSLAFGRSGNFYEATITSSNLCPATVPSCNDALGISISTAPNNGQAFTFGSNFFVCSGNCTFVGTTSPRGVPDQEHIAADRFNASSSGGDQVYAVWRDPSGYGISCSNNSGTTWSAAVFRNNGSTDFGRITVGQDGFVYVATTNGGNIEVDKWSSCSSTPSLQFQFNSVVATGTTAPPCPIPGLDRCETGNDLRSPMVAVDDQTASHVFVSYATNTSAANENVIVQDSKDGAKTWGAAGSVAQVNNSIIGRRYMPWVCAVGGTAYVSWYDRRNATATQNDVTDYFAGTAASNALGNLAPGVDFQINAPGTGDPECASGWPCLPRSPADATSCSTPNQVAGQCGTADPPVATDSKTACTFKPDSCTLPETCRYNPAGGCPKYGDYNGNACAAGRLYTVFASATSQPGAPSNGGINLFFSKKLVCCDPQIQLPSPLTLSACAGAQATTAANVCNTGKADLEVDSIAFSDFHFFASQPSSGFPVIVSPDSCFPFQVNFIASGKAPIFATMTVNSNDTVNPAATVGVTGNVSTPSIATAIANSGNFGGVCIGSVADLPLTINNTGQCTLSVADILPSDAEYSTASVINYPLNVAAGASTAIQLAFKPTLPTGNKPATIDVVSNDPVTPNFAIPVTGLSEAPLVSVTGTTNFGNVCAGTVETETYKVCNLPVAGTCQLNVTNVALNAGCKDFTIISNPFPEYLGAEVCGNVVVQFTPTSDGTKTCNLIVTSTDPATPINVVPLTGTTPIPSISISPPLGFPPTVEGNGKCAVSKPFPVTNTGICPLTVTGVTLGAPNPEDYGLVDLPNQRNVLAPGASLSAGGFAIRFAPIELNRNVDSSVDLTYISDPILKTKTTVDTNLCGEGVFIGARVLVTLGGVPVSTVDRIQLIQVSTSTVVDNIFNATLRTITPKIATCSPFQFHREYGTVSDMKALAPGTYQVKVTLTVAGKQQVKTVTFTDNSCGFAHPVVVAF
jgi:hypothetical protein